LTSGESGAGAGWIRFDRVEIDLVGRRVFVEGRQSPLEPKAFEVLALLARQPGRAFTRDEILDSVWGHRHVTPGVLNRIVTLLRHALGETADRTQHLHTLRGVGYRLDASVHFSAQRATAEPLDVAPAPPTASAESAATIAPQIAEPAVPAGDATPGPIAPPHASSRWRASDHAPPRRLARAVLLLLPVLAILAIAGWKLWLRAPFADAAPATTREKGIAVLPLLNASGDSNQQFFADGISESLINTLSALEGLKVIGRSSSFQFREGKQESRAIGAKLGVTHLVEGSVQHFGENVRIGIELIRAADGSTVWAQRFDRPYRDLFALQDEIALAVAGALQVRLLHAMAGAVETGRPASGNLDAYNAYLRGTYYMGREDMRKAIGQFAEATQLDPNYAQAWSWLGFMRTQYARANLAGEAARAVYAQARTDIDTALRLAPDFGQAHGTLGNLLLTADYDWTGALVELRKAVKLAPDTDPVHGALSRLLATQGKVEEAIEERRKYISGDPLSGFAHVYLAKLQASLGRLDEAEANLHKAMELAPDNASWHAGERSYLAILRGDAEAALAEAERMAPDRWRDRTLALAVQIGKDRATADAALQRLIETDGQVKGGAYAIARVHALRGDADKTFEWLQRDWDRSDTGVHGALVDPLLLRFRDDPRFAAYCRQTGLPLPSTSEALALDRIRSRAVATR
jgi:TolB-like protein/DNA-binding winged helix-turn-helix (wHTH) protein